MNSVNFVENNELTSGSGGPPNRTREHDGPLVLPPDSLDHVRKKQRVALDSSEIDGVPEPHQPDSLVDSRVDFVDEVEKARDTVGAAGSSCHQCKSRRSIHDLIFCTNVVDKKNKHCRKKYCHGCLKKFYKEDAAAIQCRSKWVCPSCRKMCSCAACRRRRDKIDQPQSSSYSYEPALYSSADGMAASGLSSFLPGVTFGGIQGSNPLFSHGNGTGQNSSFAMLYAVAQMPRVRASVKHILDRKDISDEEKVEAIAALLRRAVAGGDEASCSDPK